MFRRIIACCFASVAFAIAPLNAMAEPGVNWRSNLDQAKLEAAQSKRLILIHFTTRTCGPCRFLDQNVFNQPQVGAAIEQEYVPVRIDADSSPALASMFRVERVPTEIILTPEGNVLASPPIPDKPEPYVAQLQNLSRHFRQAAGGVAAGAAAANINPAYASLPIGPAPTPMTSAAAGQGGQTSQPSSPMQTMTATSQSPQPQAQSNPFINNTADNRYGQAQGANGSAPPAAAAVPPSQQPTTPSASQHMQQTAAAGAPAAQQLAMPSNAMPHSYRGESTAVGMTAAAAAPAIASATPGNAATALNQQAASAAPAIAAAGAAAAGVVVAKTSPPQLPAGSPPVAFDGFCPVTLKTLNRWTPGDAQFGAVHRGRTYLFAGVEQRDQFLANPDAYSPVFAGLDPVLLMDKQQAVEGTRALGYRYGDSFYLFSSKETMQKFREAPHTYAAGVRQAMNRLDAPSGGTLRR